MTTTAPAATLAPPVQLAPTVGFRRLVQVEGRKMVDTRSGRWLLIVTFLLVLAGAGLGISLYSDLTGFVGPAWHDTLIAFIAAAPSLLVPVMAILAVSSEWAQRTALTTFTVQPRRGVVSAAKAVVMFIAATVSWVVILAMTAAATAAGAALSDQSVDWTMHWSSIAGGYVVFLLVMYSAFAIALALQHPAASIVVFLAVPLVAAALAPLGGTVGDVVAWTDLQQAAAPLSNGFSLTGTQWAHLATSTLLWIVTPTAFGLWRQTITEPR